SEPPDGGRSYLVPRQRHRKFAATVAAESGFAKHRGLLAALAPPANVRRRFAAHRLQRDFEPRPHLYTASVQIDGPIDRKPRNHWPFLRNSLQRFRDILLVRIEFERRFETRFCLGLLSLLLENLAEPVVRAGHSWLIVLRGIGEVRAEHFF